VANGPSARSGVGPASATGSKAPVALESPVLSGASFEPGRHRHGAGDAAGPTEPTAPCASVGSATGRLEWPAGDTDSEGLGQKRPRRTFFVST
jgi:hypothetical protein